jgi:pyrimidine deaminase RibD-like protein
MSARPVRAPKRWSPRRGRVVAAMRDPFPQVDGCGFENLQAGGYRVEYG